MRINASHPIPALTVASKVAASVTRRPSNTSSGLPLALYCRNCGQEIRDPEFTLRPDSEHGASIACEHCDAFLAWAGNTLLRNLLSNDMLRETRSN